MNCLVTFLHCSKFLTDPTGELETDELTEKISGKCKELLKIKHPKRRFEYIDKYTRNEIIMMDDLIPSPNAEHILEVAIDDLLDDLNF